MEIIAFVIDQDTKKSIRAPFSLSNLHLKNAREENILIGICWGENCKFELIQDVD